MHRIGRTGRAGRAGRATALFVPGDEPKVGNGALWPDLARILDENRQPVPDWFDELRPRGAQPRPDAAPDSGPPPPPPSGRRRGASDARRTRRASLFKRPEGAAPLERAPSRAPAGVRLKPPPLKAPSAASNGEARPPNRAERRAAAAAAAGRAPNAGPPN